MTSHPEPAPPSSHVPARVRVHPGPDPERAAALAAALGLEVAPPGPLDADELRLVAGPDGPGLTDGELTLVVDYAGGRLGHRLRRGLGRSEPLAKAAGLSRLGTPRILDATAGLCRDALLLAAAGCPVTALERSALLVALVDEALDRARRDGWPVGVADAWRPRHADAREVLAAGDADVDVVLIDPMFPTRTKSALVRQEMRLLARLVGPDADAPELLPLALAAARRRVVVKRPTRAPPLADAPAPDLSFAGRTTRFDVYLVG